MTERAATMPRLQFWFEFGSTYSYLSVMRIADLAARAGVELEWCPFLLGPIFAGQGWDTSPFSIYPAKGRHMWRDMERRAAIHGVPFRRPSVFPRNSLLAARIVVAGLGETWMPAFVRGAFAAAFARDADIADRAVLRTLIDDAGGDGEAALGAAGTPAVKRELRRQTDEAAALGIFGAPSFMADGELFWGDDRLEEALAWCLGGHPGRR